MARNLDLLENAALRLGQPLVEDVVFVGGSTLGLIVTDDGAAPIRPTLDVDVIAEILTYRDYAAFSDRMRERGFREDSREGAPVCRWTHGTLTLDLMALSASVLGFTNKWYPAALKTAVQARLPNELAIRMITAPFFLGTKMEAFRSRGAGDFFGSHDLEDFVAVIEGRDSIVEEIADAPLDIAQYLSEAIEELLAEPKFLDALPGFLPGDSISQRRVPLIVRRLRAIAKSGETHNSGAAGG